MVHIVEETFDVNVHHIMQVAQLHILVNLSDSVLLAAIGTEPITVVMKLCFTNGLQYLQYALLNQSVEDGRDSQWTDFSVVLTDFYSSDTLRNVPCEFSLYKSDDFLVRDFFQICDRFAVRAGRVASIVLFHVAICQPDIFRLDYHFDQFVENFAVFAFRIQLVLYFLKVIILGMAQFGLLQSLFFCCHSRRSPAFMGDCLS